jgi:hypothetical protein
MFFVDVDFVFFASDFYCRLSYDFIPDPIWTAAFYSWAFSIYYYCTGENNAMSEDCVGIDFHE